MLVLKIESEFPKILLMPDIKDFIIFNLIIRATNFI